MQELEKILKEIEAEFDRRIGTQLKIMAGLGNDVYRYGYGKSLEAYQQGKLFVEDIIRKHLNDGWISVDDKLPEDDVDVLITYADIDDENYTDICITTYGYAYLGGNKLDFKEWRSPFEYFKTNYKVIAWRPLPEPYSPERREEHDRK